MWSNLQLYKLDSAIEASLRQSYCVMNPDQVSPSPEARKGTWGGQSRLLGYLPLQFPVSPHPLASVSGGGPVNLAAAASASVLIISGSSGGSRSEESRAPLRLPCGPARGSRGGMWALDVQQLVCSRC